MDPKDHATEDSSVTKVSSSAWLALAIISGLALVTMYGETMVLPQWELPALLRGGEGGVPRAYRREG